MEKFMSKIFKGFRPLTRGTAPLRRLHPRIGVLALALLASTAFIAPPIAVSSLAQTIAAQQTVTEDAGYTEGLDKTLWINADKSSVDLTTYRFKVQSIAAVQQVSQQTVEYVESKDTLEIVAAFTEKADGTKVPVNPATFITRDAATGLNGMFKLGHKVITVVYPHVEVGDTVVLTSRKATRAADRSDIADWYLQEHVSLSRSIARADSTVQVIAPASLPLKVGVRGEGIEHTTSVEGTETRHVITYRGRPSLPSEERMTSQLDRDPAIFVSMFADYEAAGRTYWAAAREAIEVTPEIAGLAGEITRGIDDRRAQARAISAWVKSNIRYVLVDLNDTGIVPHLAGAILKNRYGDCKDHVTLTSALLAAKGIGVEQVLINAGGNRYVLSDVVVTPFDHVMVYLPEFGIYDDPTARFASFGVLNTGEYDKPVVHVSDAGARRARIPAMKPEDHVSIIRTRLSVAAGGAVSGETELAGTGWFASNGREMTASVQSTGLERSVEVLLRNAKTPGKGKFEIGSLTDLGDSWSVRARFTYDEPMAIKPAASIAFPAGPMLQWHPGEYLPGPVLPNRKQPFTCFAGTQIEEIDLTFAEGLPLPQNIDGRRIETASFVYTADYRLDGRTLKVRREFVSRVPEQVCDPAVAADIAQPLRDITTSNGTRLAFAEQVALKPAPAKAADILQFTRTAAAGRPLNVDFLYALNPDCSSIGVAGVRTVEAPKHGKLTIGEGTGFASFPKDDPLEACNLSRSEGMQMHYQSEPGYRGPDSITVDVIYNDGSSKKRHYAIAVDQATDVK
jgi:transglutaminase-like putative cysteine protease